MFDISITVRSRATKRGSRSIAARCRRWILTAGFSVDRASDRSEKRSHVIFHVHVYACAYVCVYVYDVYVLVPVLDRSDRAFLPQTYLRREHSFSFFFSRFFSFLKSQECAQLERDTEKVVKRPTKESPPKV